LEADLTIFLESVTTRRMGRPPLKVKPMLVRLPEGTAEKIDALVGPQKRAEFISEAVERELKRRERVKPASKT
jgi:hypothetical protein